MDYKHTELEFGEALLNCTLRDGVLTTTSSIDYKEFSDWLRSKVLGYQVPHYKLVAIRISGVASGSQMKVTQKIAGINKSYIDIFRDSRYLVLVPDDEDLIIGNNNYKNNPDFSKDKFKCVVVTSSATSSSGDIYYSGYGVSSPANFLIPDIEIVPEIDTSNFSRLNVFTMSMLFMKGTGTVDFNDYVLKSVIRRLQADGCGTYAPMRTYYDLTEMFMVKMNFNETFIKLLYKQDVNETYLEKILRDFGRDIIEKENLNG